MARQRLTVVARDTAARDVVRLTLARPDGADLPSWTPGAHLDVHLADHVRQYSLCGDPADTTTYSIAVLLARPSRGGSVRVHSLLTEGAEVEVGDPRNNFELEPAAHYLFVAGGIGITPLLPMLRAASVSGSRFRLAYGGRTRDHMAFLDELTATYGERVEAFPEDRRGLLPVRSLLTGAGDAPELVYCCGPEPLLAACEREAADLGLAGALRAERFTPSVEAATPGREFEVELASTGRVLTVPADRSVLEVLLDAGIDIDSSCREGTCGTCEVGVLGGTPDHRDAVLTPAERAEGGSMFVCVSRARSDRLTLDL